MAGLETKRIYSLRVFKTSTDPSSADFWSSSTSTVHEFPISSVSAGKFMYNPSQPYNLSQPYNSSATKGFQGSRDGLVNLFNLPEKQLQFLQSYVDNLNAQVSEEKDRLERIWMEENRKRKEAAEKAAQAREKARKERKEMCEKARQMHSPIQISQQDGEQKSPNDTPRDPPGDPPRDSIFGKSASPAHKARHCPPGTDMDGPDYTAGYIEFDPADTVYRRRGGFGFNRPMRGGRRRERGEFPRDHSPSIAYHGDNPADYETFWTIEDVQLSFVPESMTFEQNDQGNSVFSPATYNTTTDKVAGVQKTQRKTPGIVVIHTHTISPESYRSFAVVLSRCTGIPIAESRTPFQSMSRPARPFGGHGRGLSPDRNWGPVEQPVTDTFTETAELIMDDVKMYDESTEGESAVYIEK